MSTRIIKTVAQYALKKLTPVGRANKALARDFVKSDVSLYPAVSKVFGSKNTKKAMIKTGNFRGVADINFFGHSSVNKQNIVKNPPQQVPQFGKDGFYSNVKNRTGKL